MPTRIQRGPKDLLSQIRRSPGGLVIDVEAVKSRGTLVSESAPLGYKNYQEH